MPDFVPRRDAELVIFSRGLAMGVAAAPEVYGIPPDTADQLLALQQEFEVAYQRSQNSRTRTLPAIIEKDVVRATMLALLRQVAATARSSPGASDSQLVSIGLKRPSKARTRIGVPNHAPTLRIVQVRGTKVLIQLADSRTTGSRGLPRGVFGASVYYCLGEESSTRRDRWRYAVTSSRARFVVELPRDLPFGTKVQLSAAWLNPRQKPGPYCEARATRVAVDETPDVRRGMQAA